VLVEEASAFMVGRTPADADCEAAAACAVKSAHAIDNLALPAAYRRKMVKVIARRAINGALSGAGA
jgi:CO/xanthine dehydrogenase FAD-binding subunit